MTKSVLLRQLRLIDKVVQDELLVFDSCDARPPKYELPLDVAFNAGFKLLSDTLRAAESCIKRDLPVPACIVSRTCFEVAAKCRWASVTKDGWKRLRDTEALDRLKMLEGMKGQIELPIEEMIRNQNLRRYARLAYTKKNVPKGKRAVVPSIKDILVKIEAAERETGFVDGAVRESSHQYSVVYKLLCQHVHGSIGFLGLNRAEDAAIVPVVLFESASMLFRAAYRWARLSEAAVEMNDRLVGELNQMSFLGDFEA